MMAFIKLSAKAFAVVIGGGLALGGLMLVYMFLYNYRFVIFPILLLLAIGLIVMVISRIFRDIRQSTSSDK
jgi:ABC-type bacteriocin/lantibiotic exporter with double-glycine peptidase domain